MNLGLGCRVQTSGGQKNVVLWKCMKHHEASFYIYDMTSVNLKPFILNRLKTHRSSTLHPI